MKKLMVLALFLIVSLLAVRVWQGVRTPAHAGVFPTDNGDLNGDGLRDISDALYLLFWLFEGGPEPLALADSPELEMRVASLETTVTDLAGRISTPEAIAREIAANHADILRGALDPAEEALEELSRLLGQPGLPAGFSASALKQIGFESDSTPPAEREFRLLDDTGDLGRVIGFIGREELSRPFEFRIALVGDPGTVDSAALIGTNAEFRYRQRGGATIARGLISRCGLAASDGRKATYLLSLVPEFFRFTLRSGIRIASNTNRNAVQILNQYLGELGVDDFNLGGIQSSPSTREFTVQYRETDFNFVSRLLEEEGVFYFFNPLDPVGYQVFADQSSAYVPTPGEAFTYYGHNETPSVAGEEYIQTVHREITLIPGKVTLRDYNFETPSLDLTVTNSSLVPNPFPFSEVYDYPGLYRNPAEGAQAARIRMDQEEVPHDVLSGTSNCRDFRPGHKFVINDRAAAGVQGSYAITAVEHVGILVESEGKTSVEYANIFSCIPDSVTFRPPRTTPKPVVRGPQTAVVVGPSAGEIHTDRFGRVKVQFHWDREGMRDENSGGWIRVSQVHAGKSFGGIDFPRIGEEVIVDFLEGDPDRPMVTGRVYHGENLPPYALPENMTRSGIKTQSSPGGDESAFNEIRFEDKAGSEELFIHAQKDLSIEVGNDLAVKLVDLLDPAAPPKVVLSSKNSTPRKSVKLGERYGDNAIVAWKSTTGGEFGVRSMVTIGPGHSRIVLDVQAASLGDLIPVVTPQVIRQPLDISELRMASVLQVDVNTFDVFINGVTGPVDGEFNFMVTARGGIGDVR